MNEYFFQFDAHEELFWIYSASSLWCSANILIEKDKTRKHVSGANEPHILHTAIMLAGYAIENLLKGILAKEKGFLDEKGNIKFKTHDLFQLFNEIDGELNPEEKEVVEIIQCHTLWMGRYPIPTKTKGLDVPKLRKSGRNHKKDQERKWIIDQNSEYIIEPDVFGISQRLLNNLKQRLIPGEAFNLFI